jgi:hypothetical protein
MPFENCMGMMSETMFAALMACIVATVACMTAIVAIVYKQKGRFSAGMVDIELGADKNLPRRKAKKRPKPIVMREENRF